ncbi:MAG: hypothetical protein MUC91_04495 [Verrucomicrobia bacterium]|nr:hypothetical protein [Verrucomicrobiota bacterium]
MAAPAISGTLALIQEYWQTTYGTNPSPALLKALLINGSRSVSPVYHFEVNSPLNDQGWGLFNIANVLTNLSDQSGSGTGVFFVEQSPDTALATGESQVRTIALSGTPEAINTPLRFTLVWTDPPGNPAAGVKLVNDLDLVVTNLDTLEAYYGNDIQPSSDWTLPVPTNGSPVFDVVNNVENVFIQDPVGTNYSVTVRARRVNVNAVTAQTNNVVQDFVLIISSGASSVTNVFTAEAADAGLMAPPEVTFVTNVLVGATTASARLEDQRVGANPALLPQLSATLAGTNGMTNQWHFYVITNTTAEFTNVAFTTSLATELSIPRMGVFAVDPNFNATRREADIDLYESTDPGLTNLDAAVIAAAERSVTRGGRETVILTNTGPGVVHYLGVKSEDQEAAQYTLRAFFSLLPFGDDPRGAPLLPDIVPQLIPNGSSGNPQGAQIAMTLLDSGASEFKVRRIVVTNTLTHENFGDLISVFTDGSRKLQSIATLLNHRDVPPPLPTHNFIFEDNDEGDIPNSQPSAGPGSLAGFINEDASSEYLLTVVDDGYVSTGAVDFVSGYVERAPSTNTLITDTLVPLGSRLYPFTVPPQATNFLICITNVTGQNAGELIVYVKRVSTCDSDLVLPSTNLFDYVFSLDGNEGECFSISIFDVPPLVSGTYVLRVFNPSATETQSYELIVRIESGDFDRRDRASFVSLEAVPLLDDAVTYASIFVEDTRTVDELEVALRVNHPRVSDLVMHLISPTGKRNLLVENRGGLSTNGLGGGVLFTNVFPLATNGGFEANTNILNVGANSGKLIVDYSFFALPDRMRVYYDSKQIYDTGWTDGTNKVFSVDFGPGVATDLVITVNEGNNSNTNSVWEYTPTVIASNITYLVLTENTDLTTTPMKFAPLPLGGLSVSSTGTVVFADGFEGAAPGTYAVPTFINGWEVITNDVEVLTNGVAAEGVNFIDINGDASDTGFGDGIIQTNVTLVPGRNYQLSFAYARNPDSIPNGVEPAAEVTLGTEVQEVVQPLGSNSWSDLGWRTNSVPFSGLVTNLLLKVASLTPGTDGVLFDNFVITEVATQDRYYLPEEPLDVACENSFGNWTLEILDNRAGASNGPPTLENWELRFIYETVIQEPIPLKPGVAITNTHQHADLCHK